VTKGGGGKPKRLKKKQPPANCEFLRTNKLLVPKGAETRRKKSLEGKRGKNCEKKRKGGLPDARGRPSTDAYPLEVNGEIMGEKRLLEKVTACLS